MTEAWQRRDSVTTFEGWTVRWYLSQSDTVLITAVSGPGNLTLSLPDHEIGMSRARKILPHALCDHLESEKFTDCPRMQQFLERFRKARQSWSAHPEYLSLRAHDPRRNGADS